jgi:ketosteroid isomerase-like protein
MPAMQTNAERLAHAFEQVAMGNGTPFWEMVSEDAVWRTIGSNSWSGEFRGKAAIINDLFRPLGRRLASRATLASRIIDGGDVVVVQARGKNVTHTGVPYDNDYCFVVTFEDGKISLYEEYCDTELVSHVLGDRLALWSPAMN